MNTLTVWRIYNKDRGFFHGNAGRTTWNFKHHAIMSYKNRNQGKHPEEVEGTRLIQYKLVEVE